MSGLDTSVVLRLLVGEPADEARAAQAHLAAMAAARTRCVVADLVIAESWHALRAHYQVPPAEAAHALRLLADDPVLIVSPAARQALTAIADGEGGAGFMDRLIHAAYEAQGLAFTTFDRQAARLTGAQLLRAASSR